MSRRSRESLKPVMTLLLVLLPAVCTAQAPVSQQPAATPDDHLCVDVRLGTESTGYLDCINAELREVVRRQEGRQQVEQMAVQGSAPLAPSQTAVFNQAASNERLIAFRHPPPPPSPPLIPPHR